MAHSRASRAAAPPNAPGGVAFLAGLLGVLPCPLRALVGPFPVPPLRRPCRGAPDVPETDVRGPLSDSASPGTG